MRTILSVGLGLVLLLSRTGWGQSATPQFPQDPAQWVNGRPITLDALKGKAAVLYYFEESCPTCKARWPDLLTTSKKFAGKPVVFIAVNSGSSRATVEQYLREVQCPWPTIVDGTREYEKASGVNEISLQNIYQARIITADGKLQQASAQDLNASAERALQGAAWKVDPTGMPLALQPARLAVEWGNYAAAGPVVKKAVAGKIEEQKQAAEKIKAVVDAIISQQVHDAQALEAKGQSWAAYKLYLSLPQTYAGFDIPSEAVEATKKLATDPQIKANQAAARDFESVKKVLINPSVTNRKRATVMLEKLIKDAGETEAAENAKSLLAQLQAAK